MRHTEKITRYTLCTKIDTLFVECIELALLASKQSKEEKSAAVILLDSKFETLKFFLQLLWEIKGINTNVHANISSLLIEIGKMIGGWKKYLNT